MLLVPKSLVALWSPFKPLIIEAESLLAACIDKAPAVLPMALSLAKINRLGWRSREAYGLYALACERLSQWCVVNKRYAHNVSTYQDIDFQAGISLCTKGDLQKIEQPRRRWRLFRRESEFDAKWAEKLRLANLYKDLPTWSMAVKALNPGDAILVTAPLCLTRDRDIEVHACLCDYPAFVRRAQDTTLALFISSEGKKTLLSLLSDKALEWHPFCRILGIVRQGPLQIGIEVLQLELAVPLPDGRHYSHEATWDEALIEESTSFDYVRREVEWAQEELMEYESGRVFRNLSSLSNARLVTSVEAEKEELLARGIALAGSGPSRSLTRKASSPFDGMDAFWCSVAALLPPWNEQFRFDSDKLSALLIAFDKAYGDEWQRIAANSALVGAIRYSPAVMATARSRIAGLIVNGGRI